MTTSTLPAHVTLDAALATHGADENVEIIIDSPEGVWLKVFAADSANVHVFDSARVTTTR